MRAILLRSLLVIAAGAVVLAGVLYVASTVDARAPEVVDITLTQPVDDGDDRAHITTSIEIAFSEPLDPESVTDLVRLDPSVEGSASASGSTLIFTPGEPLELATEYTVIIEPGVRDLAGNEMEETPEPFVFATTDRPALASSEPADGATDVPVDTSVGLAFTGLMDTASVESAIEIEPGIEHELRWSGQRLDIVPLTALEPGTEYVVRVGEGATDVAGVELGRPVTIAFRTVAAGLEVGTVIPSDGVDGISPRTPIAVVFDRALDMESIGADLLNVQPDVGGTLEVVAPPDGSARILRFTPSAPLPPNTTVEVTLAPDVRALDGGTLAEPVTWSFTTGAPQATLSNQILFLTDRGGVANVWAMNPDGTGQRQVTAELVPILDYAVAPNGSSLVVADGRRLVYLRADGAERRVLTDEAHLEFDPVYATDGFHVAFARADAESGELLGLWRWEIGAGGASRIELPGIVGPASPSADADVAPLRAPRYSPDTGALAFVDLSGRLGILELPGARMTLVDATVASVPTWHAGSGALLLRLREVGPPAELSVSAPVAPLDPGEPTEAGVVRRSGTQLADAPPESEVLAYVAAPDGGVGWIDADGAVHLAANLEAEGEVPRSLDGARAVELVFGPTEGVVVIVLDRAGTGGPIERVDLDSGERTRLSDEGWRVRWLP